MNQESRPSGVIVISVLEGVVSFFLLFGGFAFLQSVVTSLAS